MKDDRAAAAFARLEVTMRALHTSALVAALEMAELACALDPDRAASVEDAAAAVCHRVVGGPRDADV